MVAVGTEYDGTGDRAFQAAGKELGPQLLPGYPDYAAKHADEIAAHTKGTLKPADKKKLEEQKKAAAKELLAQLKREQQTKK